MKKAFTLLELIFVIIIIGILSGVVANKINTNRQTAYAFKEYLNFITFKKDLNTYYIANNRFAEDENNIYFKTMSTLEPINNMLYLRANDNTICHSMTLYSQEEKEASKSTFREVGIVIMSNGDLNKHNKCDILIQTFKAKGIDLPKRGMVTIPIEVLAANPINF